MKQYLGALWLGLAILLVTELAFRTYLYGVSALLPWRMNSYTQIHDSGLVQAATVPAVYYELKPNLRSWYKGRRFSTNPAGQRDREYSVEREPDTFRIAVLGSSWEMGSGVDIEDTWHSVLEGRLNQTGSPVRYELINFGVDQYGLGEIIGTLEHKVPDWQPDMIIVAVTHYTPTVLWLESTPAYRVQPQRHPMWEFHFLRLLDHRLDLGLFPVDPNIRDRVEDDVQVTAQLQRARARLEDFSTRHDVPVVAAKLAYSLGWFRSDERGGTPLAESPIIHHIDVTQRVVSSGYSRDDLRVSVWDNHPNPLGHSLIAEALLAEMQARQLLP